MPVYVGWKLIVTPRESEKVQKHAFHFGYMWPEDSNKYIVQRIFHQSLIIHVEDKKIYSLSHLIVGDPYYDELEGILVKDFLKLTLPKREEG